MCRVFCTRSGQGSDILWAESISHSHITHKQKRTALENIKQRKNIYLECKYPLSRSRVSKSPVKFCRYFAVLMVVLPPAKQVWVWVNYTTGWNGSDELVNSAVFGENPRYCFCLGVVSVCVVVDVQKL